MDTATHGTATAWHREGVLLQDRFELGERMADGPCGTRYRARALEGSPGPVGEVALVLLPPHVVTDRRAFTRLARDFAELRRLEHPNVERLLDLACNDHTYYYTSALVDGESLRAVLEHLRPERLDTAEANDVVRAVGAALAYAHSQGVIHGRVRAEHVMVTMDQRCVLGDFLAHRLGGPAVQPATVGADVRSLARLALELYTGLPAREALQRPLGVPAEVLQAIRAVLHAQRSEVPPSAQQFLAAAGLADDDDAEARTQGSEVEDLDEVFVAADPARSARQRPAGRSVRRVYVLTLIAAVALLGLASFYRATNRDWRDSAVELRRFGSEVLHTATARLGPSPQVSRSGAAPRAPASSFGPPVEQHGAPAEPVGEGGPALPGEGAPAPRPREAPAAEASRELSSDAPRAVSPARVPAPVLSFDIAAIAVRENHGAVAVDVVRAGDTTGTSSVAWWTMPGTAAAYDDYASFGTSMLEFGPGESVRRVLVPLVDDGIREPDETFTIHLAERPRGAAAGRVTTTRVTVHDDD